MVVVACVTHAAGFHETIVANDLQDPMELAVLPDGDVLIVEREGRLLRVHPSTGAVHVIGNLRVAHYREAEKGSPWGRETGLLGVALAPDFHQTANLFIYYSDPEKLENHLSRFTLRHGLLDPASERLLLVVPTERDSLATHMAGSVLLGADGCLYVSTGDNTNPFESGGFAPIDDRAGRDFANAMRTSGDTNDLRGKILRIRPTANGYEIPQGNLFPPGTPGTKPEIFVMGCRNPFRLSMDRKSHTLYWGEVGPDAGKPGKRGPEGFDEINQASSAGNYGWPFVIADNKPYPIVDFANGKIGPMTDPLAPVNPSRLNKGLKVLPPARPAFIWYPYAGSPEFPTMGSGGRNAMAGPVFYHDPKRRFNLLPAEDDRSIITYDWMRGKAWRVKLDDRERFVKMDPILSGLTHPIDMEFASDGALYVLEYGTEWYFSKSGRLRRILPAQPQPAPRVALKETAPGKFEASASPGAEIRWFVTIGQNDEQVGNGTSFSYTREDAREVRAVATDKAGHSAIARKTLDVSALPQLALRLKGNPSKAAPGSELAFEITGAAESANIVTRARYVPSTGHDSGGPSLPTAIHKIAAVRQCFACHQADAPSVGPRYTDVSLRYRGDVNAAQALRAKIKAGGAGSWGAIPMPPQVALTDAEAEQLIPAILALADDIIEIRGAARGSLRLPSAAKAAGVGGGWEITAEAPGYNRARLRIGAE